MSPERSLDHRNYGAWYITPKNWEKRFHELSNPKAVEMIKHRRIPRGEKAAMKQETEVQKVQLKKYYLI